jgi:hypothetical protein
MLKGIPEEKRGLKWHRSHMAQRARREIIRAAHLSRHVHEVKPMIEPAYQWVKLTVWERFKLWFRNLIKH